MVTMPRKPRIHPNLEPKKEKKMSNDDILREKKEDQNVWVENLKSGDSVYRSNRTGDAFPMSGNGKVGSVISVPVKVAKEAFFRRSVSRGAMQLLTDGDAADREEGLVFEDDRAAEIDRTMESLEKGASENTSRFKKKGLTDDGSEGKSQTAREVWEGREPKSAPGTVRQSRASEGSDIAASDITAPAIANADVPEGPIPAVLTEPVHEGEWKSDTGE